MSVLGDVVGSKKGRKSAQFAKRAFKRRPTYMDTDETDEDLLHILQGFSSSPRKSGSTTSHLGRSSADVDEQEKDIPDREDVYRAAYREKLQLELTRQVISFWKDYARNVDRKSPEFQLLPKWVLADGPEKFRQKVMQIAKIKREAKCLGIEVDRELWQYRMQLAWSKLQGVEAPEDRHQRLHSFWEKFHAPMEREPILPTSVSRVKNRSAVAAKLMETRNNFFPNRGNSKSKHPSSTASSTVSACLAEKSQKLGKATKNLGAKGGKPGLENHLEEVRSPSRSGRNLRSRQMLRHQGKVWDLRSRDGQNLISGLKRSSSESAIPRPEDTLPPDWMPDHGLFLTGLDEDEPRSGRQSNSPTPSMESSPRHNREHEKRNLSRNGHGSVSLPRLDQPQPFAQRGRREAPSKEHPCFHPPLLPMADTFKAPWCKGGVIAHTNESSTQQHDMQTASMEQDTPTDRYLKVCRLAGIVPKPMPFVTGHSQELDAGGFQLVDDDLKAISTMVRKQKRLEAVKLDGNSLLTDRAMVPFLRKLFGPPAMVSLEHMSLRGCSRIGKMAVEVVVALVAEQQGVQKLRHLDLSGVTISSHQHLPLCNAVYEHPALRSLNLEDTGIGQSPFACQCVSKILGSGSLQKLDLGWNCFQSEVFDNLASSLETNQDLRELSIANCSAAPVSEDDVPIAHLLEGFARDRSLTKLDLSMNRMDFRAALVLEDALSQNNRLTDLVVSYNPLGVAGMRCVLRLLCRNSCGLVRFQCDRCGTSGPGLKHSSVQTFNPTSPACTYVLNLSRPYDRAMLRLLYDICERFGLDPNKAFHETVYDQGTWTHPKSRDSMKVWVIPPGSGILETTFSLDEVLQKEFAGDWDSKSFSAAEHFVEVHKNNMLVKPAFRKVSPLLAQFRSLVSMPLEQSVFLDALSKDFILQYPHLEQLSLTRNSAIEVLTKLLHCIGGGQSQRFLVLQLSPSVTHYLEICRRVYSILNFNVENPTGHYKLKLENPADYAVADQLLLLNSWESCICQRQNQPDVSQKGNYSRIRNERFAGRLLGPQFLAKWTMPPYEKLELDYVTSRRPPVADAPLDENTWNRILKHITSTKCSYPERVEAMRRVSSQVYITTLQLRELLGCFRDAESRMDMYTVFTLRIVDPENQKLVRARIADERERAMLLQRMGHVTLFPFIQPEQTKFELNFTVYEERLAAFIILNLGKREGMENMVNLKYIRGDGIEEESPQLMRWMAGIENFPQNGTLSLMYKCDPEDRCLPYRRSLAEEYGGWTMDDLTSGEVLWWTSIADAPPDAIEFLEFLLGHFSDLDKAFTAIDGADGNGQVTLKELEHGLKRLKCTKFKTDRQRLINVFRWLDPGNEGTISRAEWNILKEMASELTLSIQEFIQFLYRMFDSDPLERTWHLLDDDQSGSISKMEWDDAVHQRLQYFGPSDCIFNYIDKDDEGTISMDEWKHLEDFESEIKSRRKNHGSPSSKGQS